MEFIPLSVEDAVRLGLDPALREVAPAMLQPRRRSRPVPPAAGKVRLQNTSRKNRMFFDSLIRELAICVYLGDTSLNRSLELPSYRGPHNFDAPGTVYIGNNHAAVGFDTPGGLLSPRCLAGLDAMLAAAEAGGLKGCTEAECRAFLLASTDLTDCHLSALNEMSIFDEKKRPSLA